MTTETPNIRTLELLERLIAFPTVSADSNLALIDAAESLLQGAGFDTRRLVDPELPKSGLVARVGPDGPGGILLSAHSDVVSITTRMASVSGSSPCMLKIPSKVRKPPSCCPDALRPIQSI